MRMEVILWISVLRRVYSFQNLFQQKYTWIKNERTEKHKGLTDYGEEDQRLRNAVLDARDVRGFFEDSYHFVFWGVRISGGMV